jgi:hypothetical protein
MFRKTRHLHECPGKVGGEDARIAKKLDGHLGGAGRTQRQRRNDGAQWFH